MTVSDIAEGPVRSLTFDSEILAGNPLHDPTLRDIWYWTPSDWDGRTPLPALWGLTGFTGTGAMLFQDAPWSPGLGRRLDRLYHNGRLKPCAVALPDCFTKYGGSQFLDSSATGRYRSYLLEEAVPRLESHLNLIADRDHRFVFGKSSGGFGALSLAMDHPDMFGAAACQSGDAAFEYCYLPDFPKAVHCLDKYGGSVESFVEAFYNAPKVTSELIHGMNIVAMAACYTPSGSNGDFDLPFELHTGRLREDVWTRWLELDPLRRLPNRVQALQSLRGLFIDCGSRDEFNLHLGARMLHQDLESMNIPHHYEEFDDGHMGISYRYETALAWLSEQLP